MNIQTLSNVNAVVMNHFTTHVYQQGSLQCNVATLQICVHMCNKLMLKLWVYSMPLLHVHVMGL